MLVGGLWDPLAGERCGDRWSGEALPAFTLSIGIPRRSLWRHAREPALFFVFSRFACHPPADKKSA